MPNYTIRQGDCVSSIAKRNGLFWKQIWDHPKNGALRSRCKDPNTLTPGLIIFIPEREMGGISCETDQRHLFRKKGVPAKFRLQLKTNDTPRSNVPYVLEVEGETFSGRTDDEGWIEHSIPPDAEHGRLYLGEHRREILPLAFGNLDAIDDVSGIQARLNNMGFVCGDEDGQMSQTTENAIRCFQRKHDLEVTGQIDSNTRARIQEIYGA